MTRDEYLKHGLEPIYVESEDALEKRLSDTGLSDFTVKPGRDPESMKALRADRAARLAPLDCADLGGGRYAHGDA